MDFIKGGGSRLVVALSALANGDDGTINDDYVELPFTTESFNPVGEFINSNAIAGGRSRGIGCIGNKAGDGSLDTEFSYQNMLYLFYSALGRYTAGTEAASPWIVYPSSDDVPTYDVYIQHGSTAANTYKYVNQKVNNFRITIDGSNMLTASIDMNGTTWTSESMPELTSGNSFQLDDGNDLFCPESIVAATFASSAPTDETYDGMGEGDAKDILDSLNSIDITIANNIDTDTNKIDASGRMGVIPGEFSVTGSMDFTVVGDETGKIGKTDLMPLNIGSNWHAVYLKLSDENGKDFYIHLRHMYFTSVTHNIDDRGKITLSLDFQCAMSTSNDVTGDLTSDLAKHPILVFADSDEAANNPEIVPAT